MNGYNHSVYDIDLTKYTKSVLLDGYNIRQFRIRHWPADADFTNSTLSINILNTTSTTIFNNLNSLSSNSVLSINSNNTCL
jgi:hypothetical protein